MSGANTKGWLLCHSKNKISNLMLITIHGF